MNARISRPLRLVLRDLLKAGGTLAGYTFYLRYRFTPVQLTKALHPCAEKGLVELDGYNVRLTEAGLDWVRRINLQPDDEAKPWRQVPEDFVAPRLATWKPYVPSIGHLDPEFLPEDLRDPHG